MASTSNSGPGINTKTHSRIETWRQEVSDATSSKEQQDKLPDRSLVHRASFLSKILKTKSGKDAPKDNDRTEMYGQDEDNERKEKTNKEDDESLIFGSESTEPDALRKRRERLDRASKLMMANRSVKEKEAIL